MDCTVTEPTPSCNGAAPPRRSSRRRLVQSTLSPHNPPKPPEKNDKHDEDYAVAENPKKRKKPKAKTTPRKKASKFVIFLYKQNAVPKKNVAANGVTGSTSQQVLTDSDKVNVPVFDLWLEAKLSAEEDSRIFAGRQIHPYFSLWKAGKKVQDVAVSGSNLLTAKIEDESIACGPIHVFENIQNDTSSSLDWRNWTFLENTTSMDYDPESLDLSVLEGSFESLNFDKLHSSLVPSITSISQNALSSNRLSIHPENLEEVSPSSSASLADQTCPPCKDAKLYMGEDESVTPTEQAGIFGKSDTEPLSRFLQESMRSYYRSCVDKAEDSLWTYKYKPTKAVEVCGNDESVNFLRDWLHLWYERCYKSRKDTSEMDKSDMQDADDDDEDYKCSNSDYDSEDINEEDSLQNVLLITGPIGSGKSAAVYACAQEQGFDILELSASDCRNGTVVKQYFGDSLGSLRFKRLSENPASSQKISTKLPPAPALLNGKAADEVNDGVDELIVVSDDEDHSPSGSSSKLLGKNKVLSCNKVQTIILVEDVDILFPEDRGCIAAIQHIAQTARGPIILTSNSDNPGLPDNFDMLRVSFVLPSPKELLCHLYTICLTEGVNIHPLLLEKFIHSCDGDIRKSIMHLQFWFQRRRFLKDEKAQIGYGSLPFDIKLGHQILPKIMPWDFPSELSELIDNEISKSANIMEESSRGLVTEELLHRRNDLNVQYMETDYIEAKKVEMINRNESLTDYSELEIQYNAIPEFSNSSGSPLASSRQNGRRKFVVMPSDSEDEDSNSGYPVDAHDEANKRQSMKNNNGCLNESNGNYPSTSVRKLVCSELEHLEEEHLKYSETADDTCLDKTFKSLDISCVPESTFVPETAIENEAETMSGAVSSDLLVDAETSDYSPNGILHDVQNEHMETIVNVMDECSRMDFKLKPSFLQSNPLTDTEMIQKLWRDLRNRKMDSIQHATSEQLGAFQVVKLASGLSNLISEADLFHNCDIMESSTFPSGEATCSWYHDQLMVSTVAEHGFCFYANRIADEGSKLGCANCVDITSEMLSSTTDIMALGKLSGQDLRKSKVIYTGKELECKKPINDMQKSETKTSLSGVIQSIVPAKLSLALKGDVFNEYLSSLRHISRSEAVRISQEVEKRRGRVRGVHHYLSRCTTLSPEDISLVCEGDLYKKISSQHTT
uniref:ATPase family AAA domain-containing protein 5 n=1 Tax=Cajanus cajan TaxID=3821 RepID=A0A151SJX7_CAJCA|nr:ATPase family AAA domain-containing protein 5 [Cajanus cajan]